jgi:hypothetical protein
VASVSFRADDIVVFFPASSNRHPGAGRDPPIRRMST